MRKFIIIFIGVLIYSCSDNQNELNVNNIKKNRFEILLSKYKSISFDTLKIHYTSGDEQKSIFFGASLDSSDLQLFPVDLRENSNPNEFYACYKIVIDSSKVGLITRTPSIYESSSIKFLLYDRNADSIIYQFELAEEWGDAGAAFFKTSWLYTEKGNPKIFITENYSYDHSIESQADSTVEQKTRSYLLSINKFHIDTISKDNNNLLKLFK